MVQKYGYVILTALLVLQLAFASFMNITAASQPMEIVVAGLGFPEYFLTILGVAQLIAAVVIAAPGMLRLKEWAYAGATIVMVSALAAHVLAGDAVSTLVPVLVVAGITLGSYFLRPADRRLGG